MRKGLWLAAELACSSPNSFRRMSKARCFGHATHSPWEPLLCDSYRLSCRLSCKARCFGHATHSPWEPLLCDSYRLYGLSHRLSCCQGTEFMRIPKMIVLHTLLAFCQALRYCVPVDMSGTWFPILMGRFDWRLRWYNGNSAEDGSCESIDWGRSKAEHWHVRVLSRLPSFVQGVFNSLNLSLNAENPTLWRTASSFDSHNVGHRRKWWLRVPLVLIWQHRPSTALQLFERIQCIAFRCCRMFHLGLSKIPREKLIWQPEMIP